MATANNRLVRTEQRLLVGVRCYLPPHSFIVSEMSQQFASGLRLQAMSVQQALASKRCWD